MSHVQESWVKYQRASELAAEAYAQELERRSALQRAQLFRFILQQQTVLESTSSQKIQVDNSTKQELSKLQHEKKLLENKISQQANEIDNLKKKSASQLTLQKDNMTLKNQISKLNTQVSEAKNDISKTKQQFLTQKAVLESKLENAKNTIKSLKNQKVPISKLNPSHLTSPSKPVNNATKPQVSNFSVSPFLSKAIKSTSPSKQIAKKPHPLAIMESSTPQQKGPVNSVLAQSTPGSMMNSPSKPSAARRPGSALKNLLSPAKTMKQAQKKDISSPKRKKASALFDDDDVDDDDLFGDTIRKAKTVTAEKAADAEKNDVSENSVDLGSTEAANVVKKKKRKIGSKAIVEVDDEDLANNAFSPLKKVKLLDKLGGISPLKQRNKERNLFKV